AAPTTIVMSVAPPFGLKSRGRRGGTLRPRSIRPRWHARGDFRPAGASEHSPTGLGRRRQPFSSKGGATDMTIVVGAASPDGIVLAADSRTMLMYENQRTRISTDAAEKVFELHGRFGAAT